MGLLDEYSAITSELQNQIALAKESKAEVQKLNDILTHRFNEKRQEIACADKLEELKGQYFETLESMNVLTMPLALLDDENGSSELSGMDFNDLSGIEKVEPSLDKAISENQRVKTEFLQNLKALTKCKNCRRCSQSYMELLNTNQSCKYHPGNKKYFSCKNCGDDPYFTCCNWCQNCISGCSLTFHI